MLSIRQNACLGWMDWERERPETLICRFTFIRRRMMCAIVNLSMDV